MINMFSQMAFICHFVLFLCPEPPMGLSSVGSFPVWPGGSLIFFQLLRCRNVALIGFLILFLEAGMFYTCGVSGCPLCSYTPIYSYTPYMFICPQGVYTPPHVPHIPLCICMFSEASACCGSCKGPLACWTPPLHFPLYGGASPYVYSPTHMLASLYISMFWGYLHVIWGIFPLCWVLGLFHICWGFWGHLHMGCPYAYFCTFL